MYHNFRMANPYDLANQKLCYIQIYKSSRERKRMILRTVGEYGPGFSPFFTVFSKSFFLRVIKNKDCLVQRVKHLLMIHLKSGTSSLG